MGFELVNNIQHICLSYCPRLDHLPPLGRLPFLEKFELRKMPAIKKLDYQCQHLKNLEIGGLEGLEELSGSSVDASQWHPHLLTLRIISCPKLEVLPSLSPSIREIYLHSLGLVSLPTLQLDCSSTRSTCGSSLSSSREVLQIWKCGKITSLGEGLLRLQHYLTALKRLEIGDCLELVDLPSGGLQYLRSLEDLRLVNCPKLQVAPDQVTPDGNNKMFLPLSLQSLLIKGCAELVRSMTALLKGLVSLGRLMLWDCEELMSLEGLMGLQSIKLLSIKGCPKLMHAVDTDTVGSDFTLAIDTLDIDDPLLLASGALKNLTSVRDLWIRDCGQIEPNVEQWLLQNQTTLKGISMLGATSIESLPDSLKKLSSLEFLKIDGASETFKERCRKHEGADWPNISHIPLIIIN